MADIVGLQEHWLYDFEQEYILQIHPNLDAYVKSVDDDNPISPFQRPRGYADVAIIWNKNLTHHINKLPDGGKRVVCIEVNACSERLCIINSYFPCRGKGSEDEYSECLDEVTEILMKYGSTHRIILMGDLNASLNHDTPNSRDKVNILSIFAMTTVSVRMLQVIQNSSM